MSVTAAVRLRLAIIYYTGRGIYLKVRQLKPVSQNGSMVQRKSVTLELSNHSPHLKLHRIE